MGRCSSGSTVQGRRCQNRDGVPASFSLTLDWELKGSHFFWCEAPNIEKSGLWDGVRGDIPNPQGSEYCVSPLESRPPTPDPLGIERGLGAQPPDCRLGRQLCRLPAETTCRHGPLKGPWLDKVLCEKVRKVRKRFGGFGTEFRTLFYIRGTCFRISLRIRRTAFYVCSQAASRRRGASKAEP